MMVEMMVVLKVLRRAASKAASMVESMALLKVDELAAVKAGTKDEM